MVGHRKQKSRMGELKKGEKKGKGERRRKFLILNS